MNSLDTCEDVVTDTAVERPHPTANKGWTWGL